MNVLEIRLLGSPAVHWEGVPLSILRRQTRMLLFRLAVLGQPMPREHLCFLFWPDIPEAAAGRNLSHLLTHLRQALPDSDILCTVDDRVQLNRDRVWSDVGEFIRLGEMAGGAKDVDTLAQAARLYRGPFMDGVSAPNSPEYESWMMLERRTLERRYREALATLIEELAQSGEYDHAVGYAHRYLAIDRLDESIHRRLIELYAARGDRAAALRQYRQCATLLERELGVQPLPETEALYEVVLKGRSSRQSVMAMRTLWTTLPGPHAPLVGRAEALEELRRACTRAAAGQGGMALITGESGIGKSRLLQHFAAQLPARSLVLVAAGQPGAQSLPYNLIIQAIRSQLKIDAQTGRVLSPAAYHVSPVWMAEVARLLPELDVADYASPRTQPLQSDEARLRMFEGLSRFVQGLAVDAEPAILCLDNLHWADRASLEWLAYLGTQLRGLPLLIVGAGRNDEGAELTNLRQGLSRLGSLTEVELAGLTVAQVQELLCYVTGRHAIDEQLAPRLHAATGGNPFYLLQIVDKLLEGGQGPEQWATLGDFPLPSTIRAAVEARLESLDEVARQVIEACAILAPASAFDLIRLTAGRRELETLDALDSLAARRLLDNREDVYRFQHDLVRRVVEASMSPLRRRLLHRRAGRALEQVNRHSVDALAYHYEAADEPLKAAYFHELAAQRAEALFAWREAEEHRVRVRALQLQ